MSDTHPVTNDSRKERAERFAMIWQNSRADAGKSREFMAAGLGVSKKTISNWEKGLTSPDLFQSSEWFRLLGLNPLHYYLSFLFPWLVEDIFAESFEDGVEETLIALIRQSTAMEKRQLLYLMAGEHGSSWYALLQMMTAHCHTSMHTRVSAARLIKENYEMEAASDELICPNNNLPDLALLEHAIQQAKRAAQNKQSGYTTQSSSEMK